MKYVIGLILVLMFLVSCTKQNGIQQQQQPSVEEFQQFAVTTVKFAKVAKFIKREVSYFSNKPLLKNVKMFRYDGNNRCIEIKIGSIDSSSPNPAFNLSQTLSFTYDNNTTLLPSSFSSVRTVFPNLVTVFYYKYNNSGLKITDSVRVKNQAGEPADRTVHYVYDKDRVYATPVLTGFSMDNIPLDTLDLLKAGNIEKLTSKMKNATGVTVTNYTFSYDKHVNPYNKLNIANSLYFESSALGLGYNVPLETHYMGVTSNNMVSWTTGSYTVVMKYLYDADNYPVKKELIMPGVADPYQVSIFEY